MLEADAASPLLRTREAARIVNLTPRTLREWRRRGVGPTFLRLPGGIRYDRHELAEWLERHRIETR
jgi:DNA-binding transcriptional MerR regulator